MAFELKNRLVIGISSRSLFDLSFENELFEREGKEAYIAYQMKNEKKIYDAGSALSLVKRLLKINDLFPAEDPAIEVVLFSRNGAETSMRIWNSIANYGLNISRGAFAGGDSPSKYIEAFSVDLFLSADEEDVRKTLAMGHAAARIEGKSQEEREGPVKIAFDGDCVLFSDESEKSFEDGGLEAFQEYERKHADSTLEAGLFKSFAQELARLQKDLRKIDPNQSYIQTALVTARNAPGHERVLRTFQEWDLWMDETFFLGGLPKGPVLKAFGADIFFDDHPSHIDSAEANDVPAAQVLRINKE